MFEVKLSTDSKIQFWFAHYRDLGFDINHVSVCYLNVNGKQYTGMAFCNRKDNFSRPAGRKIALARAIQAAIPRSDISARRAVWDRYQLRAVSNHVYNDWELKISSVWTEQQSVGA